jgi:hypothetical protein
VPSVQLPNVSVPTNPQITQAQTINPIPISSPPLSVQPNLAATVATSQPTQAPVVASSPQKSQVIPSIPAKSVQAPQSTVANVPVPQSTPQNSTNNAANSTTVPSPVTLTSPIQALQVSTPIQATPQAPVNVEVSNANTKEKPTENKPTQNPTATIDAKVNPVKLIEEKKPAESSIKPLEKQVVSPPPKAAQSSPVVKASTLRLATVTTPPRKKPPPTIPKKVAPQKVKSAVPAKVESNVEKPQKVEVAPKPSQTSVAKLSKAEPSNVTPKTKRIRTKVQHFQSPTPELALVTKLSTQIANGSSSGSSKNGEDKLTLFYK